MKKNSSLPEKVPLHHRICRFGLWLQHVLMIELKRIGIVIQILRTPQMADVDRSGIISASEALLLGIALSLDSFGAGLGAAMIGFSPLLTALVISTASGVFPDWQVCSLASNSQLGAACARSGITRNHAHCDGPSEIAMRRTNTNGNWD